MPELRLPDLRRYAVARSLFAPTGLVDAVERLGGFVQADPLRAPARAQDLLLRHRVRGYRAGDLERRYPQLPLQEDFFINYGFVTPGLRALMHPRQARRVWDKKRWQLAQAVLAEVERLGEAHPAEVDAALDHGSVKNWFGGNSRLSTELLDGLHYRGMLDVVRRDNGTRCYALASTWAAQDPQTAMDAMADALVQKYAPLPAASLNQLISMLAGAAFQWQWQLRKPTQQRARERLAHRPGGRRGLVLAGRARTRAAAGASLRGCACWRLSIPSSGTAAASSCSGAGPTASRPTRRRRGACAGITRCRCCGAIR